MGIISKLAVTAVALVVLIAVFGKFIYTDVIWLGIALIGVLGLMTLHLVEAAERLQLKVLSSIPRLLLGILSLILGVFSLEPLYSVLADGNPRGLRIFQLVAMIFIAGLFLFVGFNWVKNAVGRGLSDTKDVEANSSHRSGRGNN